MPQPSPIRSRNLWILIAAQALLGAQMPMIFIMAGLAGQSLASDICWATLPISMMVVGSMCSAQPLSHLMQRFGRRAGFMLGTVAGGIGAAVCALGLYHASFSLFVFGAFITGIYMSAQGFYRFAAADAVSEPLRPKAISWVMAGGLIAALLGPQLVKLTSQMLVVPFLASYFAIIGLNLAGMVLFSTLNIAPPPRPAKGAPTGRSRRALLADPAIRVAIVCATVSYALMNLIMTSSPMAIVGCGFTTGNAADVVSSHVLAMYIPSFFTGALIARFGAKIIIAIGMAVLACASLVALSGVALTQFFGAMVLLGLGWNFGFIGATALLTQQQRPEERGRLQGLNDLLIFSGVALASFASGGLMNCAGGSPEAGWYGVNLAAIPFLALAGASLIWLWLAPKHGQAEK